MSNSNKSIGIVAFSMEQQGEIENALELLGVQDPIFEAKLEEESQKIEDDQFSGLFVKNLENVQGDERDVIIMSICYAHNATGKMYMNFGPINRRGGEKRLNVIFSRAKRNMMIISSILPHEITNDYNEGANYFKKFLSYAKSISENSLKSAYTILESLNKIDDKLSGTSNHIFVEQIEQALEQKGLNVKKSVGQSSFKCDLVAFEKDKPNKKLAILIDHHAHYKNEDVLEQYVLKPSVLKSFGWKVLQVYSKDWLFNPEQVIAEIINALKTDEAERQKKSLEKKIPSIINIPEPTVKTEVIETVITPEIEVIEEKVESKKTEIDNSENDDVRLEFIEGTSSKFWQIKQINDQIQIEFGRIGNKAQVRTKEFESEKLAQMEMEKMIQKKKAKGYKES